MVVQRECVGGSEGVRRRFGGSASAVRRECVGGSEGVRIAVARHLLAEPRASGSLTAL